MKRLIRAAFLAATIILVGAAGSASAGQDKVTLCHAAGLDGTTHYVTLTVGYPAAYGPAGHFYENGTPRAGHEEDYLGPCSVTPSPEPSSSPQPTPSVEPSVEPSPSATPTPTSTPTPTPTSEPSATPSPTATPSPLPTPTSTPSLTMPPTDAAGSSSGDGGSGPDWVFLFLFAFAASWTVLFFLAHLNPPAPWPPKKGNRS